MRVVSLLVLFALTGVSQLFAQGNEPLRRPALGPYHVIALRVEFQPDTTRFTTGDGTFDGDLFQGLEPKIDPLPHDSAYFAAHLTYLSTYVHRVSDAQASVQAHVLPEVVRVSQPMGAYAPTGENANDPEQLVKLARLIEEAWTLADQQIEFATAGLDPERTAFVIFHAGVGRDLELTNTTLDRTPEDLPSLFLGPETMGDLLPQMDVSFNGLRVDHSLVLPRTESRRGVDFITDEPFLVEISINGMLAASFFNYLGVPDLFDTESGQSAIGPFGLMDPLGIFAYGGLFSPEPSAWTRYFLGWVEPIEVRGWDSVRVALQTSSAMGVSDVARVWISESEYFLVENRQRDVEGDDLRVAVIQNGAIGEYVFENGVSGFISQDVSAFPGGVVVAVDDYDWALPGGVDEEGIARNGGILIWHVDETVIREKLAYNAVNSNPARRGVDLEEADSAQDLGFPSDNPFAPAADLGSPFDFWFEGNPVRVVNQVGQEIALYQNRFGPDTYPSSDAAAGGVSFVELADFSPSGNEMAFTYRPATNPSIQPLDLPFAEEMRDAIAARGVPTHASIWDLQGQFILNVEFGEGNWLIGQSTLEGDLELFEGLTPSSPFLEHHVWVERVGEELAFVRRHATSGLIERTMIPGSTGADVVGAVVSRGNFGSVLAEVGGEAVVFVLDRETVTRIDVPGIGAPIGLTQRDAGGAEPSLMAYGRSGAAVPGSNETWSYTLAAGERVGRPVSGVDAGGFLGVVPLPDRDALLVLGPDGAVAEIPARTPGFSEVALADADGDYHLEIYVAGDSVLHALTRSGAVVAGFPIRLAGPAVEAPVLATGGTGTVVLVPLATGVVDGYEQVENHRFRQIAGFPFPFGTRPVSIDLVDFFGMNGGTGHVVALSESGLFRGWVQNIPEYLWRGAYAGSSRHSFAHISLPDEPAPSSRLLISNETYNWPNPIRDGRTFIRCAVSKDSRVEITIIDGAGRLVDKITIESVRAGVPTEVEWETNASSGLYFARVRAIAASGGEDTRVVKMAVIR